MEKVVREQEPMCSPNFPTATIQNAEKSRQERKIQVRIAAWAASRPLREQRRSDPPKEGEKLRGSGCVWVQARTEAFPRSVISFRPNFQHRDTLWALLPPTR